MLIVALPDGAVNATLADDEVITGVQIPAAKAGTRSTYQKVMDREAWTHAVVSAAVVLKMDGDTCRTARVVLGGVAPIPWRLPEVEKMLTGQRMTDDLLVRAGEKATEGARPLAKNAYKVPLLKASVKQALRQAAHRRSAKPVRQPVVAHLHSDKRVQPRVDLLPQPQVRVPVLQHLLRT